MTEDDRDLYRAFAAVRREELLAAPPFKLLPAIAPGAARRRPSTRLAVLGACLAALLAIAFSVRSAWLRGPRRAPATASITVWKPSTDFLLETPGREMLESVPAIGEWRDASLASASGARSIRSTEHKPHREKIQ